MVKKKVFHPVSLPALTARINRKLAKEGQQLKKTRGGRAMLDLGQYHIVDLNRNFIAHSHCDPETVGRELEVLAPWEKLEDGR